MKKYLLISIALVLLLFSCKKEEAINLHKYAGLPDATQSGENTMGCLMNGIPWVANIENPDIFSGLNRLEANYGENRKNQNDYDRYNLDITCKKRAEKDKTFVNGYRILEQFYIRLKPIKSIGIYRIDKYESNYIEYMKSNENEPWKQYVLDTLAPIVIDITKFDTIQNIVTGLFDFRLKRISDKNDTLRISKGRFDANYWPK
jgi:hypothetical protein